MTAFLFSKFDFRILIFDNLLATQPETAKLRSLISKLYYNQPTSVLTSFAKIFVL
jgi:hypothetical protein